MKQGYSASALVSLLVGMVLVCSAIVARRINSAIDHQPSYAPPLGHTSGSPPIAGRVLYIIVDGLREDVSHTMPAIENLRSHGAWGRSVVVVPSLSQPSWATLVSGASPEISGSSLINAPYNRIRTLSVDTLFDVAHANHLPASIAGQIWWKRFLRADSLSEAAYAPGFEDEDDAKIFRAAQSILRRQKAGLILVYFGAYDERSHECGALSAPALQSAAQIDRWIGELVREANTAETCIVVTADHGHLDAGGHGGTEYVVTHPPVVFAGTGASRGERAIMREEDIAPTIAALLGLPLPNSSMAAVRVTICFCRQARRGKFSATNLSNAPE